ncbi:MAG TPA: amidohydrolase family protein, partial [Terriglobales bacterium]|nr:amidohydrolase family protein [Terriglobales bacterium]
GRERPPETVSWAALAPLVANRQPALFVADEMLEVLRAAAVAKEAGITARIVGAGDEYKRAKEIAAAGVPLVVPVSFPDAPDVSDGAAALEVTTEELRAWDQAPGNPAALRRAGVTFALTANGLKDPKTFRAKVAKAIARGLAGDDALAAVTTVPARLLGLDARLGTIAPGKVADLTLTRGDLFSERGAVREVWVDGNRYEVAKDETTPKGEWTFDFERGHGTLIVSVEKDTSVRVVVGADTVRARDVRLDEQRLRFTAQQAAGPLEELDLAFANDALQGSLVVPGVGQHHVTGRRVEKQTPKPAAPDEPVPTPMVMGNSEAWRCPEPPQPAAVLVRNATIWTEGPRGILEGADLLVRAGKIAAVGKGLAAPAGAVVVDGTGTCVAPGIIDEHSHSAILGEVNECTNSVTAEVRIQDVVNSESVNIYRQLAGGVTAMHLLHGSCNAVGGQNAVIKNRWGAPPDRLILPEVMTIKLALGENPKASNEPSGPYGPARYPQTRSGVEQTVRDALTRARDYREAWAEWRAGHRGLPPRRDLQLDALVEVLDGRRLMHPHAYRQDEMLALMRVASDYGIRIGSFEHTLEGYKIADEMAAHGAAANTFSDWWAYKMEVIDAIPWNGAIMTKRGVTVTYGSDSDELARHLNTEAAKAVKYGGMAPAEALKLVTWNAAKVLGLEKRMGSLEPGKDADFAIWSGSPLSAYSVCEQTWVDGRKYFDRAADLAARPALARERDALIAKAKAAKKEGPPGARPEPPRYLESAILGADADAERGEEAQP